MKPSIFKDILQETYVAIISFIIGIVILNALYHQVSVLGVGVFDAEPQRVVSYAKAERNIINFLLFAVVGVSGAVYGVVGIFKFFIRLHRDQDAVRGPGTD